MVGWTFFLLVSLSDLPLMIHACRFLSFTGRWLFVLRGGPTWTAEAYHLAHMPTMVRETPDPAYFGNAKYSGQYFYDDAQLRRPFVAGLELISTTGELRINVVGTHGVEKALANYGVISGNDMSMCTSFLHSTLRLRLSDRTSVAALVQHEWLKV